jgi:predicted DNA-binding transcriptional regulator AlpA
MIIDGLIRIQKTTKGEVQSMNNLLSEKETAEKLGISLTTLRRLRYADEGPAFTKIGKRILYRPDEIDKYIELKTKGGLSMTQERAAQRLEELGEVYSSPRGLYQAIRQDYVNENTKGVGTFHVLATTKAKRQFVRHYIEDPAEAIKLADQWDEQDQ